MWNIAFDMGLGDYLWGGLGEVGRGWIERTKEMVGTVEKDYHIFFCCLCWFVYNY